MMAALPQTMAQPGLAAILASPGAAGSAGAGESGFGQLFAGLPTATLPDSGQPVDGAALTLPVVEPANDAVATTPAPAQATAPAAALDAAAAASLLIAAATPAAPAPVPTKLVQSGDAAEDDAATPAPAEPTVDPVAEPLAGLSLPALPVSASPAPKPAASTASERPVCGEPDAGRIPAVPAKPAETPASEAKATKPADGGASMAVIFAQPATAAAAVAETAKSAPVAERVLDTTSDEQWIARLAADIAATKSDKGDVSFRLMPRHLGRLDVAMTMDDGAVSLKLDTRHEAAATIVTAAQPRLVEDLRQQGVRVAGTEVTCTPEQTGRQQQGQGRGATAGTTHLIETATGDAAPHQTLHDEDRAASRRGRFA